MADVLVSKFLDPDTEIEAQLVPYSGVSVQLGFFNPGFFFDLDHEEIVHTCDEFDVDVRSIHAPTVDVFDEDPFFKMLGHIRQFYGVDNITIHPGRGTPLTAFSFFEDKGEKVESFGIDLMYENFDDNAPNKRWLPRAKNIVTAPVEQVSLTYDTSHVDLRTNVVRELRSAEERLGMVHLSDRTKDEKHLPVHEGDHDMEEILEYLSGTDVLVCLEYIEQEERLIDDYHALVDTLE